MAQYQGDSGIKSAKETARRASYLTNAIQYCNDAYQRYPNVLEIALNVCEYDLTHKNDCLF